MNGTRTDARAVSRTLAVALAAGSAVALATLATPQAALAGPKGERIVRGQVQVDRQGPLTTITASNKAIIRFDSFNIAPGEAVQFIQPGVKSRVLNRVTGPGPSTIDGALSANGRVYIVNPAGVIFGPNSIVNAGAVVAAGGNITDRDFLKGIDRFTGVTGPVTVHGLITADAVHLIGSTVANHGTIVANNGIVSMLAGDDVLLRERGESIAVRLDQSAHQAQSDTPSVDNSGSISAPGGRVSLSAGDTVSLAIRNSGSVSAPGGTITVSAPNAQFRNDGALDTSVTQGKAGRITVEALRIANAGSIRADAESGQAGNISVISSRRTDLESGSITSARGGSGHANAGEVIVHSIGGDTYMAPGATVDVSGGALGGHGGFAEVSATNRLAVDGNLKGDVRPGFRPASLLLDPLNIIVAAPGANDPELDDGLVTGNEGGSGSVWRISPNAIEGFDGSVRLEATNDIFITQSINKANGGITLRAGRDIIFGDEFGGFVFDLSVTAHFIDFSARRSIVDRALITTSLTATNTDLTLIAETGTARFGLLSVPPGRTVSITQAESMFVGAGPFGFLANPEQTNLQIHVTQGFLVFGGDFGGVTGSQQVLNIDAQAAQYIEIQDDLDIANSGSFRSFGDVLIDGNVIAGGTAEFHAGLAGMGDVSFLSPGLVVQGLAVTLRAGDGAGGSNDARVDVRTNLPTFQGPSGPGSQPVSFSIRQDAPITGADLPLLSQFGGSVDGVAYQIQSDAGGISLTGTDLTDSVLTISSLTGATIDTDLNVRSLVVFGPLKLNANVTSSSLQRYEGPVVFCTDISLTGSDISFMSTVDGPGAPTINAPVAFFGQVGSLDPLRALTLNGPGNLNGSVIRALGDLTFNAPIALAGHSFITSLEDGAIRFTGPIDGPFDLSLTTTPDGLIAFSGPVGSTTRLRDLFLSTSGGSGPRGIPSAATVITEGDARFSVRDFVMGRHEKLTALGALDINATRQAFLGDLVSTGNILVNAPLISLLRRQPGDLADASGGTVRDRGLDFIAGGSIVLNGALLLAGDPDAPNPTFGSAQNSVSGIDRGVFEVTVTPSGDVTTEALVADGRVLDQRTRAPDTTPPPGPGPSPEDITGVSDDLAGATDLVTPQINDTVSPELYLLNLLRRIALLGREPTDAEVTDSWVGRAIFNDLPDSPSTLTTEHTIAATRIHRESVAAAVRTFDSIFGPEGQDRSPRVRERMGEATGRYMSITQAASIEPASFRSWLESPEGDAEALATIASLNQLVTRLRGLGLTPVEYRQARDRILAAIAPDTVSLDTLAAIIESDALAQAPSPGPQG